MMRLVSIAGISGFIITQLGCTQLTIPEQAPAVAADTPAPSSSPAGLEKITNPTVRKNIASVRAATAHYHQLQTALEAGYVQVTGFIPEMGIHYQKLSLVGDGKMELEKPEALVYIPQPHTGKYKLVAVEYMVLKTGETPPANTITGDAEQWHVLPAEPGVHPAFWTLHAWVWQQNPAGMFHDTNPRIGLTP